ncbi:MAG: hypothetical protein RL557_453 [archaeon]
MIIGILVIIFFHSLLIAQEQAAEVCFSDGTAPQCLTEEGAVKLFDDGKEFAKLTPKIREAIMEKYYNVFLEKFKQKTAVQQADFLMTRDDKGRFTMSDKRITDTYHSLESTQQQQLVKTLGDRSYNTIVNDKYFQDTYGKEKGEFAGLREVLLNDPNKELQWKTDEKGGLRLVGKKGGYINFGEGKDSLSKFITEIKYDNGKFTVKMGNDITVDFEEGTPAPNGGFFSPDGKLVGGDKLMSFLLENKKDQRQKKFTVSFGNENGKTYTEIRISAVNKDATATGLKFVDVKGNNYYIGLNPHNFNDAGDEGNDAVVRIDEEGIISVKAGFVETEGYGNYRFSNNQFTALIGNVFNEPGQGVKNLEQRIKGTLGEKLGENVVEEAKKIFGADILQGTLSPEIATGEEVVKKYEELQKRTTEVIEQTGVSKGEAQTMADAVFKVGKNLGYFTSTTTFVENALLDLGISSYSIGKDTLRESIQQFAHPSYEQFQQEGKSFLYVNEVYSDFKKENVVDFFASGGYMAVDITKVKGTIDSISANNFLHKTTNGQSNGEIIYFNNGGFLLGFRGSETVDSKGNVVDAVRNPYSYTLAQKEIGAIKNWADTDDKHYYVLTKDSSGVDFFRNDERVKLSSAGSKYLIGDRFGVQGTVFYAGGAQLSEIPKDPQAYPLPDDSKMEFIVNPQVVSYNGGIGWRIRQYAAYDVALPQIQSQATQPTVAIANQIDSSVDATLSKMVSKGYGGDVTKFFSDISRADFIIKKSDYYGQEEADTILESFFPGQSAQETRDMVYLMTHPEAYTRTLQSFASAGTITSGVSAGLSNKGFYFNGQYVADQDPRITSYLLKQATANPPSSTSLTLSQAQAQSGSVPAAQDYDFVKGLTSQFSTTSVKSAQPQTTVTIPQAGSSSTSSTSSSSSSSSTASRTITTTSKTPRQVCVRRGVLGRRTYCYYVYD